MSDSNACSQSRTQAAIYREINLLPDIRKNTGSATDNLRGEPAVDPEAGNAHFRGLLLPSSICFFNRERRGGQLLPIIAQFSKHQ